MEDVSLLEDRGEKGKESRWNLQLRQHREEADCMCYLSIYGYWSQETPQAEAEGASLS